MKSFSSVLVLAAVVCAVATQAAPSELSKRGVPSGSDCAGTYYSSSDLQAGIDTGLDDDASGDRPDNYPHAYKHYADEHIELVCSGNGPWSEFPLEQGSTYNGGSPGADRVIYDTNSGAYCATVTHTGSSQKNGFVQCDDN